MAVFPFCRYAYSCSLCPFEKSAKSAVVQHIGVEHKGRGKAVHIVHKMKAETMKFITGIPSNSPKPDETASLNVSEQEELISGPVADDEGQDHNEVNDQVAHEEGEGLEPYLTETRESSKAQLLLEEKEPELNLAEKGTDTPGGDRPACGKCGFSSLRRDAVQRHILKCALNISQYKCSLCHERTRFELVSLKCNFVVTLD